MRVLGLDLDGLRAASGKAEGDPAPIGTLVLLDEEGRIEEHRHASTLPDLAAAVGAFAGDDPFLLGVNLPTVAPRKAKKARPVDNLVRRRFGFRMAAGGRGTADGTVGVTAEALLAGLAAAGQPCLPYPDRDRRKPGLAEVFPGLTLKALLWLASPLPESRGGADLPELFRAFGAPEYRLERLPSRTSWADQAAVLDRVLRLIDGTAGFDIETPRNALGRAESLAETEAAASLLDAALIAGTARRYLEAPEESLFLGEHESGYVILPADPFIRRLASDARPTHGRLFPKASLRQRLGSGVKLRATDLLSMPGKPQRLEATFPEPPGYEFDNLDEMLWWKHTRHVDGSVVPTEGLQDLVVTLEGTQANGNLKLVRSRHRTLSFRFEPPAVWRRHVPTRDGKTYAFRILRATYEILPGSD